MASALTEMNAEPEDLMDAETKREYEEARAFFAEKLSPLATSANAKLNYSEITSEQMRQLEEAGITKADIDRWNAEFDAWNALPNEERWKRIKWSLR